MSSSTSRKSSPALATTRQQAEQLHTTRFVVLDDSQVFLKGLELSALRTLGRFEVHAFHTGSATDFPGFLKRVVESHGLPDAVLIDLVLADTQEGQSGLDYLQQLRRVPEFLGLPVVIATGAGEDNSTPWNEEEYGKVKPGLATIDGADDYLLGKKACLDFLEECKRRLPFWRVQAHNRLWQTLLHLVSYADLAGSWAEWSQGVIDQAFQFMHRYLDVEHAILRLHTSPADPNLVLRAHLGGDWESKYRQASSKEIPILQTILDAHGMAVAAAALSREQAGVLAEAIQGRPMLAVALCPPGEAALGVLSLMRERNQPAFSNPDKYWVERFGESLTAIFGQARHVQQLKDRQSQALNFARTVEAARDERQLCQGLAEFLHKEVHGDQHRLSKVTVRLIAPGEPVLRRYGSAGVYIGGNDIPLHEPEGDADNHRSVYASVVNGAKSLNVPDVTAPDFKDRFTDHDPGYPVHSELCVPLLSGTGKKVRALGAVNLEHTEAGYYQKHDQDFVETLATYASQAIRQLRQRKLAEALLEWAVQAHRLTTDQLWEQVENSLFAFCGYGALLHLSPPDAWPGDAGATPWNVERVHLPVPTGGMKCEPTAWQDILCLSWPNSFVRRSLDLMQQQKSPLFQGDPTQFIQAKELLGNARQRGNALAPLVTRQGDLIGMLVLLWFHHPALGDEDEALLSRFGRYCAELVAHQKDWASQKNRLLLAEQRAVLSNAAKQFEHILINRVGGIGNALNALRTQVGKLSVSPAQSETLLTEIGKAQNRLVDLDRRSQRAILYMRVPVIESLCPEDIWNRVAEDIADKAGQFVVTVVLATSRSACRADPEILYNILYILLDNALDALKGRAAGHCWLETRIFADRLEIVVADNGPGVHPSLRTRLFVEEGVSNKHTLGVGLFLARQRARAMDGDLDERGGAEGARFVLTLPMPEEAR